MSRHSKNNTSQSFFTYAEKQKLDYGTREKRVGADSLKSFDACYLCLHTFRQPLSCSAGHLACKECLYENIMSQKALMKQQAKKLEFQLKKEKENETIKKEMERKITEEAFIHLQKSISSPFHSSKDSSSQQKNSSNDDKLLNPKLIEHHPQSTDIDIGTNIFKRANENHEMNENERKRQSKDNLNSDLSNPSSKMITVSSPSTQSTSTVSPPISSQLSSFWIPSLTPSAEPEKLSDIQKEIMCTVGNHPISLKTLIPVHFTTEPKIVGKFNQVEISDRYESKLICPSCRKTLTNSFTLTFSKHCGHVLCHQCMKTTLSGASRCFVCDKKVESSDIIFVSRDGTGFAAGGGKVLIKKYDIAFQ